MSQHARPHLETHSRKAGHSAVAGVAYRLGLRLYDRRAGKWHDFRRRKLGEEIVRALTVAPKDAPGWATDPAELWNRAEAAEKRKDAQVARDYRIPIPFGLSDQQAGDLAEDMARFIARELHTSVSLGLHRDADVDVLGNVKAKEKQGFHAHLYFPTRRLEEIEGEDGTSAWGLGAKLSRLSNKNSSGAFVEMLNQRWADLANRYTARNGLPADYDHRSYERQELPIEPQKTLGQAATAMERKGFFTRRGDALRGDIIVPSLAFEKAHAIVMEEQRRRAAEDRKHETAASKAVAAADGQNGGLSVRARLQLAPTLSQATTCRVVEAAKVEEEDDLFRPVDPGNMPAAVLAGTLVERFRFSAGQPKTSQDRQLLIKVLALVRVVERVLGMLRAFAKVLGKLVEEHEEKNAAGFEPRQQLGKLRVEREKARQRLRQWEAEHPWRMKAAKAVEPGGKPLSWMRLDQDVRQANSRVQATKALIKRQDAALVELDKRRNGVEGEQQKAVAELGEALSGMWVARTEAPSVLLAVTRDDERQWFLRAAPWLREIKEAKPEPEVEAAQEERLRYRPQRNRGLQRNT